MTKVSQRELEARLAASVAELERQRAAVLHANQLKNDLIAVLAHDIKGPLTSIIGFSELLEEGMLDGDAATDAARTIRTNAQRLATLTNDVLALSRVEHGEFEIKDERVDLAALAKKMAALHGSERDIRLDVEPNALVRGDAERLEAALDNLLRNAIKYAPASEPIDLSVGRDGDRVLLAVRDRGIGIPEGEIAAIFDRFARGSNARRAKIVGSGIGLFIVKTIVEQHGGSIEVQSVLDGGSTFTVVLPSLESREAHRTGRVILVTADGALARFAAYELRMRGLRVREAATLSDALDGVRSGDMFVVDERVARATDLRAMLPNGLAVRLIGLTETPSNEWDVALRQPLLVSDLVEALVEP